MGGISLSILFQYYRPLPLMIPVRWNFLFLFINSAMVALLLKEKHEAERMSPEEQLLYKAQFSKMGFTDVEFYRLISCAKKKSVEPGFHLCRRNHTQHRMYFILDGNIQIKTNSHIIAEVDNHSFVGEMSFLSYLHSDDSQKNATADAVGGENCVVYEWNFDELKTMLTDPSNRGVSNAFQAFLSCDLRKKLFAVDQSVTRQNSINKVIQNNSKSKV